MQIQNDSIASYPFPISQKARTAWVVTLYPLGLRVQQCSTGGDVSTLCSHLQLLQRIMKLKASPMFSVSSWLKTSLSEWQLGQMPTTANK